MGEAITPTDLQLALETLGIDEAQQYTAIGRTVQTGAPPLLHGFQGRGGGHHARDGHAARTGAPVNIGGGGDARKQPQRWWWCVGSDIVKSYGSETPARKHGTKH